MFYGIPRRGDRPVAPTSDRVQERNDVANLQKLNDAGYGFASAPFKRQS